MPRDGIDERDQDEAEKHEGAKLDSLSHSARDDRGGSSGEHKLEEELDRGSDNGPVKAGRPGNFWSIKRQQADKESLHANDLVGISITAIAKHQGKANAPERNGTDRKHDEVLCQDVHRVLAA